MNMRVKLQPHLTALAAWATDHVSASCNKQKCFRHQTKTCNPLPIQIQQQIFYQFQWKNPMGTCRHHSKFHRSACEFCQWCRKQSVNFDSTEIRVTTNVEICIQLDDVYLEATWHKIGNSNIFYFSNQFSFRKLCFGMSLSFPFHVLNFALSRELTFCLTWQGPVNCWCFGYTLLRWYYLDF